MFRYNLWMFSRSQDSRRCLKLKGLAQGTQENNPIFGKLACQPEILTHFPTDISIGTVKHLLCLNVPARKQTLHN